MAKNNILGQEKSLLGQEESFLGSDKERFRNPTDYEISVWEYSKICLHNKKLEFN